MRPETAPSDTSSSQTAPSDKSSTQTAPSDTSSTQTAPSDTSNSQTAPNDTCSTQTAPSDKSSTQTAPSKFNLILLPDSFLTECSKHTYCYYVHTHKTYDTYTYSIYFWCGTHMLVWVIICFAFSVLFPVLTLVLTLGTSPVLQPNDPLWSNMWGKEETKCVVKKLICVVLEHHTY